MGLLNSAKGPSLEEGILCHAVGDGAFFSHIITPEFLLPSSCFATMLSSYLCCRGNSLEKSTQMSFFLVSLHVCSVINLGPVFSLGPWAFSLYISSVKAFQQ